MGPLYGVAGGGWVVGYGLGGTYGGDITARQHDQHQDRGDTHQDGSQVIETHAGRRTRTHQDTHRTHVRWPIGIVTDTI